MRGLQVRGIMEYWTCRSHHRTLSKKKDPVTCHPCRPSTERTRGATESWNFRDVGDIPYMSDATTPMSADVADITFNELML